MAKVLVPKSKGSHRAEKTIVSKRYYQHIDGLRGFALSLVVIFHVFIGKVSSGVDIFLFIGGLLLLSSQIRNATRPDGLTFIQSLIRILRRLYPALIVVISTGVIASVILTPPAQLRSLLQHASASALYAINWVFISEGSSYARAGSDADVFQHLWSMSVQLQIYVCIIALAVVCARAARRYHKNATSFASSAVAVFMAASFAYALWMQQHNQTANYYSTFSRFWEIALGGLVGVYIMDKVVFSPILRWISTITGIVLIIGTGIVLDGAHQFPGALTLVPLVGAMLVIFSGNTTPTEEKNIPTMGPVLLFETPFMLWLGKISYSLYLWHWVVLIIGTYITDRPAGDIYQGCAVIAISVVLAWVTHTYIEVPLRQKTKPRRMTVADMISGGNKHRRAPSLAIRTSAFTISALIVAVTLSPVAQYGFTYMNRTEQEKAIASVGGAKIAFPGAKAFTQNQPVPSGIEIEPNPDDSVETMYPQTQIDGCFSDFDNNEIVLTGSDGSLCEYGDIHSDKTLYVVGGSHSEMYLPALDDIAKRRGIKIIPLLKMGCALYHNQLWNGEEYPGCIEYSDKVMDYVIAHPPTEGVFHTSTRPTSVTGIGPEIVPEGYIDAMKRFADNNIRMFLVRDIPWSVKDDGGYKDMRICASSARAESKDINQECGFSSQLNMAPVDPALEAYKDIPGITLMDMSSGFIKDNWVNPVVGNTLVYRDSHHLTNVFVMTLIPTLEKQMFPAG